MALEGRILPKWEPPTRPRLKETEAERQIAFSQEQRRAQSDRVTDTKTAEDRSDRRPMSGAGNVEDRLIVSRSAKRSRPRERRNKESSIIQERSQRRRESVEGRWGGRPPRSSRKQDLQDRQSREGSRSSRRYEPPRQGRRNGREVSPTARHDSPYRSRRQRSRTRRRSFHDYEATSYAQRRGDRRWRSDEDGDKRRRGRGRSRPRRRRSYSPNPRLRRRGTQPSEEANRRKSSPGYTWERRQSPYRESTRRRRSPRPVTRNRGWSNPEQDYQAATARDTTLEKEKRAAFALAATFMEGEDRLELLDKAGLKKNKRNLEKTREEENIRK